MVRNIQAWDAGKQFADRISVRVETTDGEVAYYGLSDHNVGPNGFNQFIGGPELDGTLSGQTELTAIPLETVRGLLNRGV